MPWVLSRVLCLLVVAGAQVVRPESPSGLSNWDAAWYIRIASEGYGYVDGGYSSYPFFPLLPLVLRAGRTVGVPYALTGVLVGHLALLVALAGVHRLALRHASPEAARLAVWAVALFPASLAFSTPYPSSIFLAASVWAFVMAEDRRDGAAAVLAVACALVRPNGVVVALALIVAVRTARRAVVVAGPSVVAVVVWMLVLRHWTGDALIFVRTKTVWQDNSLLEIVTLSQVKPTALAHLFLGLVAVLVLVSARDRLPLSWLVLSALYLGPPFVMDVVGLGRYSNECFPVGIAAGMVLVQLSGRLQRAALATSALGLAAFGGLVAAGRVVP